MRFKANDEGLPQIMVIPMIDIMFFLLVFFMIATVNMSDAGTLPIKLASMQNLQTNKIDGLTVAVDKDNQLFLNGGQISGEQLLTTMQKAAASNPEMIVILRIDKNSQFYSTSDIINLLKRAGVKHCFSG